MWKLANIIPIPKPNKDTNMGTSYRPISLLSVVAKTLEKCLLPYITANITQTPTQHGYKAFVANYIKGRKAYTSFRNHKSIQRQVKTEVPHNNADIKRLKINFSIYRL